LLSVPVHADDLLQIFTLAERQDPVLAEARARFGADQTQLAQGRARLLPTISLNGRTSRNAQAPAIVYSYADGFNAHGWGASLEQSVVNLQT
jgi:outer membrane protein TolC